MKPPKKGDKPIIDRSRYQAELSRPLAYGNNVVATDTIGLSPQAVQGFGLQYYGGSIKDKDIIYKKGDSYYIYNEQPEGGKTLYGLVEVGNPFRANTSASAATAQSKVIDPMKVPGYNGMLPPVVERYYKGGVVKKYNGYALGTDEEGVRGTNNNDALLSGVGSIAANALVPGLGQAVAPIFSAKQQFQNRAEEIDPETGQFKNQNTANVYGLANGLINASPLGALGTVLDKDKSFGDKALAVGTLGLSNAFTWKKDQNEREEKNREIIEKQKRDELAARTKANHKASLEEQFAARGFSKGGEIKGKGTGTSDSIKAKVEPGSFVVPAKNADKAEMIRAAVLKKAPKRAKLNQSDGVEVRLSNGEHLFSPEERMEIESAGIDLTQLAPDAQSSLSEHLKCGGKVKMWKGGKVKGYAEGTTEGGVEGEDPFAAYRATQKEKLAKDLERYKKEYLDLYNKANSEAAMGIDKTNFSRRGKELEGLIFSMEKELGTKPVEKTKAQEPVKKAPPKTSSRTKQEPVTPEVLQSKSMSLPVSTTEPEIRSRVTEIPTETTTAPGSQTASTTTGFPIGLDQAIGYALPAFQLAMGAKALKDAGPRPKDQLDPDYLDAIAKARKNLDLANAEAKFGFTPEELYSINQSNTGAYRDARLAAQNFSGGSASNSYSMDRRNVNDFFTRGLEARINNRKLQLAKREMANEQQRYVDNLVTGKANMNRNLFQDDMNAWQQNQSAGASLLGAGLSNAIGASRYTQELNYMKERDKKYGVNH